MKRLDNISQKAYAKPFASLTEEQRMNATKVFSQSSNQQIGYQVSGQQITTEISNANIFKLTMGHAMQRYFSDPRHGGNKNYVAWDSIKHICHMNYQKENLACSKDQQ